MPERKTKIKRGRPVVPKKEQILGNGFTRIEWTQITGLSKSRRVPYAQLLREAWDEYYTRFCQEQIGVIDVPADPN